MINKLDFLIYKCEKELIALKPQIVNSEAIATIYNKILIKKAILIKKRNKNNSKFINFFKNLFRKPEKRICDYFKINFKKHYFD